MSAEQPAQTGPVCYEWQTPWPHAVPNLSAIRATDDRAKVTCDACLWAFGSMQRTSPKDRR